MRQLLICCIFAVMLAHALAGKAGRQKFLHSRLGIDWTHGHTKHTGILHRHSKEPRGSLTSELLFLLFFDRM